MVNNQKYVGVLVLGAFVILITLILLSFALPHLGQFANTGSNTVQENGGGANTAIYNPSGSTQSTDRLKISPAGISFSTDHQNTGYSNIPSAKSNTAQPQTSRDISPTSKTQQTDDQPVIGQQQVLFNLPTVGPSPTPTIEAIKPFTNALGKLFTVNNSQTNTGVSPSPILDNLTPALENGYGTGAFVYYPQCDGPYDNTPLPGGCNVCDSGCGPTTVAMILSSYVNKRFTPPTVINLYKNNNMYAGCDGTKITDAQTIMEQNGLKTTDLLILTSNTADETISDFKSYLNTGWTLFVLARYCANGCSHYFWITGIDGNNNVWAYDPFYGRKTIPPPFNENQYAPYPQYRAAFGVKKR